MTFVNESCFATVPSCTVSGFLSGIHTVMTFALKKQKRRCRRAVLCGQQTGFIPVEENSLVMTFASESGFATMLWSKHFATQNGLRPPRFLRGAYFAVHWSKHFAMQNGLLSKFCYAKPPIQNFASQSGLRPPHHSQSILLRKTVFDRPVFFGVHTLRFISVSGLRCF